MTRGWPSIRKPLPLIAALAAMLLAAPLAAQPTTAAPSPPPIRPEAAAALHHLRTLDGKVASIGHRLATAARELCETEQPLPGLVVHDLGQYAPALRAEAARQFGLDRGPAVLALAAGGPAERAGLRLDDVLLAADGVSLAAGTPDPERASFAGTERVLEALEGAFGDGRAVLDILRAGAPARVEVVADAGCATRFQLMPSPRLNARADGRYVQVTSAIGDYATDDDELAWVLAHEFAHNVLGHRRRLAEAGVPGGFRRQLGRNARLVRGTELEADRLSVYLMARAGYDPEASFRFWSRYGPSRPSFLDSPSHPRWRDRVAALTEELARLRALQAAGRPLVPAFLERLETPLPG